MDESGLDKDTALNLDDNTSRTHTILVTMDKRIE